MKAGKLIGTVVVGAALFVPVAQAQSPDDRAEPRGPGGIALLQTAASKHPDSRADRGVIAQPATTTVVRPDDRGVPRGPGAYAQVENLTTTHPDNRAEPRGPGAFTPTVVVRSSSTGFDWSDALIGGLGGVGTALLLTGCLFLLMSQRSRTRTA